jgi:dolichol kinase
MMQDQSTNKPLSFEAWRITVIGKDISKELVRKSLHLLIACTPTIANLIGTYNTILMLALGIFIYNAAEYLRLKGIRVPLISRITEIAMRQRDQGHFVLGPITLGLGAMLALFLYPEPAATVAIYALAFGDGLSSVAGKVFGTVRIPFSGGKSVEGSLTCFVAVLMAICLLVPSIPTNQAVLIALIAAFLEVLPSKDFDNIILPVGTGLATVLIA